MHRSLLYGPALGAALFALPALAQPAAWLAAHPRPTQETMAGQRATIAPAAVGLPGDAEREALAADRMAATQGPTGWLKEAQGALRRGRIGEANELLERAETRVLSRSTPAPMADRPMQAPMLEYSAAARAALAARDRNGAMQHIAQAMDAARAMDATGSSGETRPAQGGSGLRQGMAEPGQVGPGQVGPGMSRDGISGRTGTAVRRDQGAAGSSMARAEHLSPPALPAGRLLRVQSSQAPASSMTESQNAMPGQRQATPASPNVVPPGPSTMPEMRGGASAPMQGRTGGSGTAMPNATGNGSGVTGAPPAGGGAAGGGAR